jgi:competence protein ComEC
VLLTGDIERGGELALVASPRRLASDVLVVPHHGSRTSSTREFLDAVAPRWAVVPVGYRNRFRHPNGEVLGRYREGGAAIARTDLDGAVTVRLAADGAHVSGEREARPRYWRRVPAIECPGGISPC